MFLTWLSTRVAKAIKMRMGWIMIGTFVASRRAAQTHPPCKLQAKSPTYTSQRQVLSSKKHAGTQDPHSSVGMQAVSELIAAEIELKTQLKRKRSEIKAAIENSDMYRTILEATMHPTEGPEVPLKVAKGHAFKVAKSTLTGDVADEGESADE